MKKARVITIPQDSAEVRRIIACVEVDTPSLTQICYDVEDMSIHHQALWLKQYLLIFKDKLAVLLDRIKELQKFKQLKEFKQLIEELLNEDRYTKVLEVLFIVSYPEVLQALEQQQNESKLHT